jgi:hypothetical protein
VLQRICRAGIIELMSERPVRAVGAAAVDGLAAAATLDTLEEILAWCHAQRPPLDVVDVVVQDELTHDVIVRAHAPTFVVFDTT